MSNRRPLAQRHLPLSVHPIQHASASGLSTLLPLFRIKMVGWYSPSASSILAVSLLVTQMQSRRISQPTISQSNEIIQCLDVNIGPWMRTFETLKSTELPSKTTKTDGDSQERLHLEKEKASMTAVQEGVERATNI